MAENLKRFLALSVVFLVWLACGSETAEKTNQKVSDPHTTAGLAAPGFERDESGKAFTLDFSLSINPLSHPDLIFSHFANRKLVIFYFSAKCIHCQKAFPHIQNLADKLQPKGVSFLAVAVKNNTEDDIRDFIRTYQCNIPVFHDADRQFSSVYGTGSIPLVMYINEDGEYMRFMRFDAEETPGRITTIASR